MIDRVATPRAASAEKSPIDAQVSVVDLHGSYDDAPAG